MRKVQWRLLKNRNTGHQIKHIFFFSFLQGFFSNIATAILLPSPTHTNSHIGILYTHMHTNTQRFKGLNS